MKILIISNYYPPLEIGGQEQLAHDIVIALKARGHQVQILTSNYQAKQAAHREKGIFRLLHLESADHIHYHPSSSLTYRKRERQNQHFLAETVAQFEPDVIFIWGMWNLSVKVAQQAEYLCPNRVVYYVASYWPSEQDAHAAYWQMPARQGWLRKPKRWLGNLVSKLLLDNIPRNHLDFNLVLCVSAFVQNHLIEKAGIPRSQTRVVYNGIDPSAFPMRTNFQNGSRLRLLYAGRLTPEKGVHTVVEAVCNVLRTQPELPLTLSIVGGGSPSYERKLRQLAESFIGSCAIHFKSQVPREKMPAILAEHDVLLFPSIWDEPLARMTQEAMASGLVVIGSTTGGTPELLQDGKNSLTFEAGNAQMLADKILKVASEPHLRIRLARVARLTIEERFTFERMVDEVEYYLRTIIGDKEKTIV